MSGELVIVLVLIVVLVALALMAWLMHQFVVLARAAQKSSENAYSLVEKQSALIAAKDALAYQAIRAVDVYGGYDDGSPPTTEEHVDGTGDYGESDQEHISDGFVAGNIFESKL